MIIKPEIKSSRSSPWRKMEEARIRAWSYAKTGALKNAYKLFKKLIEMKM